MPLSRKRSQQKEWHEREVIREGKFQDRERQDVATEASRDGFTAVLKLPLPNNFPRPNSRGAGKPYLNPVSCLAITSRWISLVPS
jgi:hypothetical protein